MSTIEVRDAVIWPKHLRDNQALREELLALTADDTIQLVVDGVLGTWAKMSDGRNGLPTPGLKPTGAARDHWHELFRLRPRALVLIEKARG